jgi:hypothetical protein
MKRHIRDYSDPYLHMATDEGVDTFSKVTYAFNKIFGNLLREIKEVNDTLHQSVKKNYKVIDKSSSDYLDTFWDAIGSKLLSSDYILADDTTDVYIVRDILLRDVIGALRSKNDVTNVLNTVYTLAVFAYIVKEVAHDDINTYFDISLRALSAYQKGDRESYDEEVSDVMDDNLKAIFDRIDFAGSEEEENADPAANATQDESLNDMFAKFGNSKICEIAKEVSKSIDMNDIKVDSPADIFKMLDFSKGGNNVLGNIVQQVTSTISSKMSNGELKQEDLVQEAMSMMGSLGNDKAGLFSNPLFASMMKNMTQGKAGIKTDILGKMATRNRLKNKLNLRKHAQIE